MVKSKIDSEGVSSMYKGAFSKSLTLTFNCSHSCGSKSPFRSFSEVSPVSLEIKRVINCTEDISNEKSATGSFPETAIFLAIDNTNAVFPIPGRAAIIIKSEGCHPEVKSSNFLNPDGIPDKPSLFEISSIFFFAFSCWSLFCSSFF